MRGDTLARIRNLTLGQKLLAAFSLLLVLLGLSLAAVLFYLARINSYVERHHRITVPALVTAADMRQRALDMNLALHRLLTDRSLLDREETLRRLRANEAEVRSALEHYRTTHAARTHPILFRMLTHHGRAGLADQEDQALSRISTLLEELSARSQDLAEQSEQARRTNGSLLLARAAELSRQLVDELTGIIQLHRQITAEMKLEGDSLLGQAKLVILALVVLLGVLILATYLAVSASIARPLRRLAATADRVAHHDLSVGFDPWPARDEVGNLARSLDTMLANLKERTSALERKTRELEAFTYSVAHDLKGPLREIEGFSSLIERKFAGAPEGLDPTARHYVATIRASALRLTAMINALLRYSRLERQDLPKTWIDLRALVEHVLADHPSASDDPQPAVTIDLPFKEVWGEPTSVRQAVTNLVDNALKFARVCPQISIGGALHPQERVLWIRDNGIGFDPKVTDRIFGLFERLHSPGEYEGTGVGLAIVKLVMEKHDGRVWAESSPGKGSTFYLAFPDGPRSEGLS